VRIGLAGIPGSGKTKLAAELKEALAKHEEYKSINIVDDYVEEIEKETDLAQGFFGTYIGNIHVALGREYRERISAENNDVTITCGTLFETSAYLAQKMETEFQLLTEDAERYDWNLRVDASMRLIACLYVDTMRYDKIYHLSPTEPLGEGENEKLERSLQAAFNAFELFPVVHLDAVGENLQEITDNRVNTILKDILNADNAQE
jgi:hypothetical protein